MTTETISDRQLEIIEAAGKILTASGISGLTIKNLAKEMKFSESAIYRHFESKEEILLMMLQYLRYNITLIKSSLSKTDDVEKDFCMFFQNRTVKFYLFCYFAHLFERFEIIFIYSTFEKIFRNFRNLFL